MRSRRRTVLSALALLGALPVHGAAPMEYRYRDSGRTARRDNYQTRLLTLALEKTAATDGPFRVVRVVDTLAPRRLLMEIDEGRRINVFVGPQRSPSSDLSYTQQLAVPVPILDKLSGFRSLIVRRADLDRFARIGELEQLKHLRAGQGRDWLDARILRHNGFRVDDSGNLDTLLPMLSSKRFDYLPMSIVEVESLLERHPELDSELAIAPDLALEYPLPMIYYVSNKYPALADRLERGLQLARKDGSFDQLLQTSFRRELRTISAAGTRRFVIANPFLPT